MFLDAFLDDETFEIAEMHGLSAIQMLSLLSIGAKLSYYLFGWFV